jgi:hypothetical protein
MHRRPNHSRQAAFDKTACQANGERTKEQQEHDQTADDAERDA